MKFNPSAHKTVHEFTAPAVYILEILRSLILEHGKLTGVDWFAFRNSAPNIGDSDILWDAHQDEHDRLSEGSKRWGDKIDEILNKFIDYHKQNKTGFDVTGILRHMDGYSSYGPRSDKGTQTFNISFKTEDARLEFAEYIDQHGYGDALLCFYERPMTKKKWIPAT